MSELAKRIREKLKALETVSCLRIKFIERTGENIVDALHRSNPWEDVDCEREQCFFCGGVEEKMRRKCKQRGLVYETQCMICNREEEKTSIECVREEETSRSAYLNRENCEIKAGKRKRNLIVNLLDEKGNKRKNQYTSQKKYLIHITAMSVAIYFKV